MKNPISSFLLVMALSSTLAAQQGNSEIIGLPPHGVFSGGTFDSVQTNNGNLHIEIPLWSAKGRGLGTMYKLVYDNKGWTTEWSCDTTDCYSWVLPSGNMQWTLATALTYNLQLTPANTGCSGGGIWGLDNFDLRERDGTTHHFLPDPTFDLPGNGGTPPQPPLCGPALPRLYAADGTGWVVATDGGLAYAISPSGTKVSTLGSINSVEDSNGNLLTRNYDNSWNVYIETDTLGRTVSLPAVLGINTSDSLIYKDSDGTNRTIQIYCADVPVHHEPDCIGPKPEGQIFCYPYDGTIRM